MFFWNSDKSEHTRSEQFVVADMGLHKIKNHCNISVRILTLYVLARIVHFKPRCI